MRPHLRDQVGEPRVVDVDLLGIGERAHAEVVVGHREPQVGDLEPGHLRVVVLARVHEHLVNVVGQRGRDRGRLDDLRARTDHRQQAWLGVLVHHSGNERTKPFLAAKILGRRRRSVYVATEPYAILEQAGRPDAGPAAAELSDASRAESRLAAAARRGLDLAVAVSMLVIGAPLLLLIAAAVRLDSSGPAVFRQRRVGRDGREFLVNKFRSMCSDADPGRHRAYVQALIPTRRTKASLQVPPERRRGACTSSWSTTASRGWALPAPDQPGRAAPALERRARRDVACGAAARHPVRGRALSELVLRAFRRQARSHRPLAGQRPQRDELRGDGAPRRGVRPPADLSPSICRFSCARSSPSSYAAARPDSNP